MAIIVICKKCHGTGKVTKVFLKLLKVKVNCPRCNGKGKRNISSSKPNLPF